MEFTHRRNKEGSTVVVMVARGLMDLPIKTFAMFHGARTEDAHTTALALRNVTADQQILAAVGYSMGAIILSNYVARAGDNCPLDAAVAISGGLDMRFEHYFYRAQRLWQPMLAKTLRDEFLVEKVSLLPNDNSNMDHTGILIHLDIPLFFCAVGRAREASAVTGGYETHYASKSCNRKSGR